jgi:DNA-directed RNA polymerase specialized sigma24 family protein
VRGQGLGSLEEAIRRHLAAGSLHAATTEAVKGYGPHILSYLIAVLQDEAAGHEVFAQFCENLWKSVGRFRGESQFRT